MPARRRRILATWALAAAACVGTQAASGPEPPADPEPLFAGGERLGDAQDVLTSIGRQSPILATAWSPDGRSVAAGDTKGTVRLWDLRTGSPASGLRSLPAAVSTLVFSSDGSRLAAASIDEDEGRLWDLESGAETRFHGGSVAFHPDGHELASGSAGGTVYFWDAQTGERLRRIEGLPQGRISALAWSSDASMLATGSWDHTVLLLEGPEGRLQRRLVGHENRVTAVAWSADDRYLATASLDGTVRVWRAQTGETIRRFDRHKSAVFAVDWSPVGPALASASRDSTALVWGLYEPAEVFCFSRHEEAVFSVAFSPDGNRLASGSEDGTLRVWSPAQDRETHHFGGSASPVSTVALTAEGGILAVATRDGRLQLWRIDEDLESRRPRKLILGKDRTPEALALNRKGDLLAAGLTEGSIVLWNIAPDRDSPVEIQSLPAHEGSSVSALAFSQDGWTLASGSRGQDKRVKLWRRGTNSPFEEIPEKIDHGGPIEALAFSPDGRLLASLTPNRKVRVWDRQAQADATSPLTLRDVAIDIAFESKVHLASLLRDGTTYIWNLSSGEAKLVNQLPGSVVAARRDGPFLAASLHSEDYVRLGSEKSDGTFEFESLRLGGAGETWIDCRTGGPCWRYDDGTLLADRPPGSDVIRPPTLPAMASRLRVVDVEPVRLQVTDGSVETIFLKLKNLGPARAYWVNLRPRENLAGGLVFYPPPTLAVLKPDQEATYTLDAQISARADYSDPTSRELSLELEVASAYGEPVPVPPIAVSVAAPSLDWKRAVLSLDHSRIDLTFKNSGRQALSAHRLVAEIADMQGAMFSLDGPDRIDPEEEATFQLRLPEGWRDDLTQSLSVTVHKNGFPIHAWSFVDRELDRPFLGVKHLYAIGLMLVLSALFFAARNLSLLRFPLRRWAGARFAKAAIVFTALVNDADLGAAPKNGSWSRFRRRLTDQIRNLVGKHGGYLVRRTGDGSLAVFRNVREALDFAIELEQRARREKGRIRAGVHVGEIEIDRNDVHGKDVLLAACVTEMSRRGVWTSDRVNCEIRALYEDAGPYAWEKCPERELKGFEGTHTLWCVGPGDPVVD